MLVMLVVLVAALLIPIMQMTRWDPKLKQGVARQAGQEQAGAAISTEPSGDPQSVATLETADQLRQEFNADNGRLRMLAILSPTTQSSREAASLIEQVVLEEHPDLDLTVYVLWITQTSKDDYEAAREASALLTDGRARHYFSSDAAASYVADAMGYPGDKAWNCIMLFGESSVWDPELPQPQRILHQLGPQHWLGSQNYATGNDLRNGLSAMASELGGWQF